MVRILCELLVRSICDLLVTTMYIGLEIETETVDDVYVKQA